MELLKAYNSMKKGIAYFWLVALMLIGVSAMAQNTEYHFGIRWRVNGLSTETNMQNIMLNFSGGINHVDTMLPASQYIRTGRNTIQFYAWPVPFEEKHEIHLSIEYWEPEDNPNTEAKTAFEVVIRPGLDDPKPEVISIDESAPLSVLSNDIRWTDYDSYFLLEISFNNHQAMPTWCWERGDVLQDNDATRDSLAREYRRLHGLFEAKDNDALMDASSTMIQELAQASGESEEYLRQRASFNMFFDSPDVFQLKPFPEEAMTLNLGADNRMAWLTTRGVSVPIIFDHVQEQGRGSSVKFYFIRRDGQWEICR